jgi:NADH-quinone oxidoreductase subunit H
MDLIYGLLPLAWPEWLKLALAAGVPAVVLFLFPMSLPVLLYVYAERKIAGFMQDRLGPMRVGPYGLLQTIADTVKLLFKEAIFPAGVDKKMFLLAPCLVVAGAFLPFAVLPFGATLQAIDLNVGVLYVTAIASLSTVGLIMAGWASNNKYSLFGAMRSAAQIVSYEIPAVMTLLVPVMIVGSLQMQPLVAAQGGGFQNWMVFRYFPIMPVAFLVFFLATLAECNRTPFDIPEAESELVAGFHTEYSGFFFAMFFLAEYTEMFVVSSVVTVLFLGGWYSPFPWAWTNAVSLGGFEIPLGPFWMIAKVWALMFVHMWLRWTLPRTRVDQLMYVAWKVLLPVSLALVVVVGGLVVWAPTSQGFPWDRYLGPLAALALLAYLFVAMVVAWRSRAQRVREMAA